MAPREERRYSREEMRKILEVASEPEAPTSRVPDREEAFSLAEIQSIGREVGIDPDRVEEASRLLVTDSAIEPRVSLGTYQRERQYRRRLKAPEMRFLAGEADAFFGVRGRVRETTNYVEWHSQEARAFVGIVNGSDGARIRAIIDRGSQFLLGGGVVGFLGLSVLSVVVPQMTGIVGVVGSVFVASLSLLAVVGFWKWRRASILGQLDELLDYLSQGPVSL